MLGAQLAAARRYHEGGRVLDIQPVVLRCPRRTWEEVFGEPAKVTRHDSLFARVPHHSWEYRWSDGGVMCIGRLADDSCGSEDIVLARAIYFDSPGEAPGLAGPPASCPQYSTG